MRDKPVYNKKIPDESEKLQKLKKVTTKSRIGFIHESVNKRWNVAF